MPRRQSDARVSSKTTKRFSRSSKPEKKRGRERRGLLIAIYIEALPGSKFYSDKSRISASSNAMENKAVQANSQPTSYNLLFSPDKPQVAVPKCVTEYKSKPADSPGTLQRRLDNASERRKVRLMLTIYLYYKHF